MKKAEKRSFPRWLFSILAIGGLMASGIYLGIMSIEGFTNVHLVQTAGFGIMGLIMFWGALHSN